MSSYFILCTYKLAAEFIALPVWCSQTSPITTGRDRASRACGSFPLCTKCCSQTNEPGIWPGNETSCAHANKIRKWRPSQQTATTECCEWLVLTKVNLRLWTRWVVGKLRAVMTIRFVLKSRLVLEPFSSYLCLTKWSEQRITKMALLLPHTTHFFV